MHRSKKSSIAGEGIASSTLGPKSSGVRSAPFTVTPLSGAIFQK
jgi:hypothetical protein